MLVHQYAYSVPLSNVILCLANSIMEEVIYELHMIAVFCCFTSDGWRLCCLRVELSTS